jgi:hypothetical protein
MRTSGLSRKCLAQGNGGNGAPNTAKPADADTATIHHARWLKTLPGEGGVLHPERDRVLTQTFSTERGVWAQCVDSELVQIFDPAVAGVPFEKSMSLNAAEPINGHWQLREVPDGRSGLLFVGFTFRTMPDGGWSR